MHIDVRINLSPNEYAADLAGNATEIAEKILSAVGGDEAKDTVNVIISDSGTAGAIPVVAPPPVVPK